LHARIISRNGLRRVHGSGALSRPPGSPCRRSPDRRSGGLPASRRPRPGTPLIRITPTPIPRTCICPTSQIAGLAVELSPEETSDFAPPSRDGVALFSRSKAKPENVEDDPGVLVDFARKIAQAGINLDLVYIAIRNRVVFGAPDLNALRAVLNASG
jgi:hypothetical protein